jgi:uncharacterized protein YndB with AHSA1/START domain
MTDDQHHRDPAGSTDTGTGTGTADDASQVTRSVDLEAGPDAVWDLLTDPERRQAWLDDDDATSRTTRIDGIEPGRSLTWTWWRPDDEASASQVHVVVTPLDGGSTRVAVTERILAPPSATIWASKARPQAGSVWDHRLLGLELLVVAAGALVG